MVYYAGFALSVVLCVFLSWKFRQPSKVDVGGSTEDNFKEYQVFRRTYLVIYCLVMASDWLQGPYIYALYEQYGFSLSDIALLFIVGFLSSAVFGTFVGSIADRYGRKLMAMNFCIIYAISCLTKLSPDFKVLMFGRVTGGIATSLLFSVFEAWMVSEHFSRGFSEGLLSDTFSWATYCNGLVAIFSGILANMLASRYGPVSPFMASFVLLVIAGLLIKKDWSENYSSENLASKESSKLAVGFTTILRNPNIFYVGVIQCLYESAMYSFVFLWSPVLKRAAETPVDDIPYGIIFSTFMVCIMIGSIAYRQLMHYGIGYTTSTEIILFVSVIAMVIPCLTSSPGFLFTAFNLFETCCGVYFPVMGMLRGKFVPEATRATIMNIFRIPLNLIVVVVLLKVEQMSSEISFFICSVLMFLAYLAASRLTAPDNYEQIDKELERDIEA